MSERHAIQYLADSTLEPVFALSDDSMARAELRAGPHVRDNADSAMDGVRITSYNDPGPVGSRPIPTGASGEDTRRSRNNKIREMDTRGLFGGRVFFIVALQSTDYAALYLAHFFLGSSSGNSTTLPGKNIDFERIANALMNETHQGAKVRITNGN
jgi:hypothetical protein